MSLRPALIAALCFGLAACDTTKITHHREWACLNAEKLNFKDPTSVKFVANLGKRGTDVSGFWVRYLAKNSYGAYRQANILCYEGVYGWERDAVGEFTVVSRVSVTLMKANHDARMAEAYKKGAGEPYDYGLLNKDYDADARRIVYDDADDLGRYL
ncbi:hypothetical protein [Hydrocarboniphaga effusa]|uniref:hypothetical protein n=1 Tax=Hydrocarboniphaga effusa TaxID=243629 RepID=UPI003137C020